MSNGLKFAFELHIHCDMRLGKKSPNYSWPKWVAEEYNKLTNYERKLIMKKAKKNIAETKVETKVETKTETKIKAGKKTDKKEEKKTDKKEEKKEEKKAEKKTEKKAKRPASTSGKYKNIRHLIESLFAGNKEISYEDTVKRVSAEFPESAYKKTHYAWYKNKIVSHGEWKHVEKPKSEKVPTAKIKK